MAYRVPRRFIAPPQEPPPYGLFALSFLGHACFILLAAAMSTYLSATPESKIYVVNLVPASPPPLGTPAPRPPEPAPAVQERTPPRPEPVRETPPPKLERPERPPERPREAAPPRPPKAEPPPPPPREVPREAPPRPTDLALPRQVEKETPRLQSAPLPPVPPQDRPAAVPPAPRVPDPPRVATLPAPAVTPLPAPTLAARPAVDSTPLGRPDSITATRGSISLDVNDFPFTYYLRQIHGKIGEKWKPPTAATAGGERAVVLFEIGRDGHIKEPSMEKSSGNALYDQAAVRAVLEASPFPPLPADFRGSSLRVHFGFEFKAEQG
jgi:TonB family protein